MDKQKKFTVNKKKQTRTKEISTMINEGGLGADRYYNIKYMKPSRDKAAKKQKDEA
ncbi:MULTISPECIES: hypothetical protein [Salimicrobium]|uniref:YfhE-like protein n=2 Tax=Salimicrobium TaxID=351195 RepID=A0ABY1KZR5_9BACI|nr:MULTISPECIES: hypothetical protein [Salimicrobium]SDY08906.1 hypothetical protein SAMN04488081_2011 [Salimicrobium album]SIS98373.1 hypothetical protein SAMN05421758_1169 [Salimicrobium salexigens]